MECTQASGGADSGLARLLGPTGHYAGPGATGVATIHRSVILLLSPQKTNDADARPELGLPTQPIVTLTPSQDTPQPPHDDHKDHHHWHWSPRSQLDAGLTLGWVALVVGGVGGCATYPANATQPATATHMLFVSLVTRIQLRQWATLRQETRHKEEWKNRQSWGVTSLPSLSKCKRQDGDRIRGSRSIFTVFQPEDWSDLLLYPNQFFEAVSLLSIWWPGATGNNYEWRRYIVPPFI